MCFIVGFRILTYHHGLCLQAGIQWTFTGSRRALPRCRNCLDWYLHIYALSVILSGFSFWNYTQGFYLTADMTKGVLRPLRSNWPLGCPWPWSHCQRPSCALLCVCISPTALHGHCDSRKRMDQPLGSLWRMLLCSKNGSHAAFVFWVQSTKRLSSDRPLFSSSPSLLLYPLKNDERFITAYSLNMGR